MIANETGGDLFQIEPVAAYPDKYDACVEQAQRELHANARPEVRGDVRTEDYDVIFIGYPNWWGDMPMAVYTLWKSTTGRARRSSRSAPTRAADWAARQATCNRFAKERRS